MTEEHKRKMREGQERARKARKEREALEALEVASRPPEPEVVKPEPSVNQTDILGIMAEFQRKNNEALMAAIKELKAPTPEQIAAEDKRKQEEKFRIDAMITEAKEAERMTRLKQANCLHRKPDGQANLGGQVHTFWKEGQQVARVRLFCKACMKEIISRPATQQDMLEGPVEMAAANVQKFDQLQDVIM